jgi:hypothetical protein
MARRQRPRQIGGLSKRSSLKLDHCQMREQTPSETNPKTVLTEICVQRARRAGDQ